MGENESRLTFSRINGCYMFSCTNGYINHCNVDANKTRKTFELKPSEYLKNNTNTSLEYDVIFIFMLMNEYHGIFVFLVSCRFFLL